MMLGIASLNPAYLAAFAGGKVNRDRFAGSKSGLREAQAP